jgi:hypothetical protein
MLKKNLTQQFPLWVFCHSVGIFTHLFFESLTIKIVFFLLKSDTSRFLLNDKKAKVEIAVNF